MSHEFVVITSGQVAPNAPVDTTLMSGIKNDLDFFNNQSTTAGSGLNNAGTALSPILDVKTASGIQIVDDTLLPDYGTSSVQITQGNDSRILTQDENDAAQGTQGTPSNTNRFVTDEDTRLVTSGINDTIIAQLKEEPEVSGTPGIGSVTIFTSKFYVSVSGTLTLQATSNVRIGTGGDSATVVISIDGVDKITIGTFTSTSFVYKSGSGSTGTLSVGWHIVKIEFKKTVNNSGGDPAFVKGAIVSVI